ncbi:MAG: hypothetical protein JOY71_19770 [Acetobacteraceae bacterium]|nr:hypothetical protein [Acetobacteraceae bacterium]
MAIATIALFLLFHHQQPPAPKPLAAAESAPLPLPDKPSIAVLPFTSIGGDAKQERLADGITEDVITDLSRYRDLFVIGRNSVFVYKGKAVNIRDVARDLGVRYVLEGSIQTSGDGVRVTAQLIEAATDVHAWSERYDRPLDNIFNVQTEVTEKIAAALAGTSGALAVAERATVRRKPPASLQAYDYYVLGQELLYRETKEDSPKAEAPLRKAIELDPQLARAYVALGHLYTHMAFFGWGNEDANRLFEKSKAVLSKAIILNPTDAFAHAEKGLDYVAQSDYDHGFAEFEKAYALNPNDPDVLMKYGGSLYVTGRAQEGADMVNRAYRLNPHFPPWYDTFADPFYAVGEYERAITMIRRVAPDIPTWDRMLLALCYAQLGRGTDVAAAVAELRRSYPDFSMERMFSEFGGILHQPTLAHYLEGARKAGLSECATPEELPKYPKMTHLAVCDARRAKS